MRRCINNAAGSDAPRKSGLAIIGNIPWGTHLCQFYQTKEDLIDILVPYFKAGLENNEFCTWVASEPLAVEDAKEALKKGIKHWDDYIKKDQIEILDFSQWYTGSGKFEFDKVLQGWMEKEDQALKKGFAGLRVTGNTFWLEAENWKAFADYEAMVNNVIRKHKMLAVCSYFLGKCSAPEIIDVVNNHQFALVKKEGKWVRLESSERRKTERKQAEEQLIQAEKMAAIGKLVSKIAHEISNPLVTILGFVQVNLSEISKDDPKYKDFKKIEAAALRCRETVRKLSGQS